MQKVSKLNASIDIIPLQGSSGTLRPKSMDSKKFNVHDHFKRLGRDQILISRVQKYMHANEKKIYIDVIEMADHLQSHYRDYSGKKRGPFRSMVRKAYDELSDLFANKGNSILNYNEDDEDDEIDLESDPRDETMSDLLLNMYKKSQGKQNGNSSDKELIDISSDDENSKQGSNKKEEEEKPDKPSPMPSSQTTAPKDPEKPPIPAPSIDKTSAPKSVKEVTTAKREREKANDADQSVPFKKLKRHPITDSKITFADVGGNDKVLKSICKLLTHMRHPEIFKQLGISPPRGFLLHGPPGCGKTLLANAIAGELNMPLLKVAAPELVAGVSGESESRIRELFDQAVSISPCVLFLDEIDAVSPHRATAQREMERRIVAQLLSCLDDLNSKQNGERVLVIGATNRPDALDPALRRAGRFDREVSLGIPDKESRVKILQVHTTKVSLASDVDLNSIAQLTPGYVGADLVALIREAAMIAVERVFENLKQNSTNDESTQTTKDAEIDSQGDKEVQTFANSGSLEDDAVSVEPSTSTPFDVVESETHSKTPVVEPNKPKSPDLADLLNWLHEESPISSETLTDLHVEYRDFEDAVKIVQPSAKREGFVTVPDVTWNDVGSLQDIRQELQMAILAPIQHSEHFAALGLTSATGVLLCGPPGCGKTLLAKAIANEAGINFISVKGPELLNMYVGESEKAVRQCFARARNSAPCVIFFDELDALCPKRTEGDNSVTSRVVNQMLTEMDGVESRQGVFVMAASNRPDIIDPAILRPGRLDKILYVGLPLPVDRVDILKALTKDGTKPKLASDVDLEKVGNNVKCESYTGADLGSLIREAGIEALKEFMERATPGDVEICMRHIVSAFEKVRPSVREKDIKNYEKLKKLYSVVKNTDVTPMETPVEVPAIDPIVEAMET